MLPPARLAALVTTSLVACSHPAPAPRTVQRATVTRSEIPAEVGALVPIHGIYLAGGGTKSQAFRVIVDTDAKTIYSGTAPAGSPIHGAMTEERTLELTPRNEEHLAKLCADAWNEPPPSTDSPRVEGYDEVLVCAKANELFYLEGDGPITRPAAVKAIEALRAAAGL
jgi:hypothetical protein